MNLKKNLIISSLMMAIGIILGAFGAHGLSEYLNDYGLNIYIKATSYWFYNTNGLFAITFILHLFGKSEKIQLGFWFVLFGTIVFSGSLFILAITNLKLLGMITPIGGISIIIGWFLVVFGLTKKEKI